MTSHPDSPALETRLDLVHARMLELHARVAALEARLHGSAPHAPSFPSPPPSPALAESPGTTMRAPIPIAMPAAKLDEPIVEPGTEGPVRVLAIAGGGALLLGLACFVAYAIEQDWLAPGLRFVLAAIASALLTFAAGPIARRGYEAVAGAIGGAGLGGWFAAWLVARHAHELVSAPQTFAALALGAAACLLVADRLGLRLMAGLATVAACATPVLVATGGRLHELMIYQLLVIVGLVILDARRRWPELPTIGLLATWLLAGSFAEQHLTTAGGGAFVAWSTVLLVVSVISAWRLITTGGDRSERSHVYARLLIAGVASWAAVAAAFGIAAVPFAAATALLGVWHLGLALFLGRREAPAAELFLGLGWLQLFALGPIGFDGPALAWWWIAMSVSATVVPWSELRRLRGLTVVGPALAAVGVCVAINEPLVGLVAAATVIAAAAWPSPDLGDERPIPWMAIIGTLAWSAVALVRGPDLVVGQLAWVLVPVVALAGWACARPTRQAQLVATTHLGLGLLAALAAVAESDALSLRGAGEPGEQLGIAAAALVLAGVGVATLVLRRRAASLLEPEAPQVTELGLCVAAAVGLALLLGVALITEGAPALGQVGYSLGIAGVGLGLIVAGLRLFDPRWRQVGLALIAIAAAKVVLFDLASAAVGWRALSFVGLGAISIAGAFAYSRAYRRALASS